MSEAGRSVQSVRIRRRFLTEASCMARPSNRSTGNQVEDWARLGRAIEASPAFSAARINAVLAGTMPVERLNVLERAAFVERLPETFASPPGSLTVSARFDAMNRPPHRRRVIQRESPADRNRPQ